MDIRLRLLLAFTPLVIALIVVVASVQLGARQSQEAFDRQQRATADLLEGQDLALAILFEHDEVGHIAEGESEPDSARFIAARRAAREIADEQRDLADASQAIEQEVVAQYDQLARLHDEVVAAAAAGDLARAQELFDQPAGDELLDTIISLSQNARDTNTLAVDENAAATLAGSQQAFLVLGWVFAVALLLALGLTLFLVNQIARPLDALTADAERYAAGDVAGQLSAVGGISQLRRLRDAFQRLIDANVARQDRIQAAVDELREQISREERLRETVQALSLPVMPLAADTLLLPIVGHLDERRAAELTRSLLEAIQERRVRAAVLDITGLVELNAQVAEALRRTVEAARLLGCQVTLVGVRADQALALSGADLQRSGVEIARDIPALLRRNGG